jgi:hypothetical protein
MQQNQGNNKGEIMRVTIYKSTIGAAICTIMASFSAPASAGRPADQQPYTWGKIQVGSSTTSTQLNGVTSLSRITLTSTLQSGDLNENGEGENLVWTCGAHDDGGLLTQYWTPVQQSFLASSDNPFFSAGIYGADGDESATIQIDVDPAPPPQWIPDDVKDTARVNASNAENNASALGTAGKVCKALTQAGQLQFKNLCLFVTQSQKTEEGWGDVLNLIANDPSDPNYKVIATPVTPLLTPIAVDNVPQPIVDAFNALQDNQLQSIGVMRAIVTSTNRATGAYDANDDAWMAQQAAAGVKYRIQLGTLMQQKPALLANLQNALRANGVPPISFSANDVIGYESDLLYNGFSNNEIAIYKQLGYNDDDIYMARNRLATRDIVASAGTFPDMFTGSTYTAALQKLADVLAFSPLGEGQQIKAEGVFDSSTGSAITYKLRVEAKGGNLGGSFEEKDHASANSFGFQSTSLTRAGTMGNKIVVEGNYTANDNTTGKFQLLITPDAGGSSKGNLSIKLSNGAVISGTLNGGDIKLPKSS